MHPFGNQKVKDVGNVSIRSDFGNWRREYVNIEPEKS